MPRWASPKLAMLLNAFASGRLAEDRLAHWLDELWAPAWASTNMSAKRRL